MLAAARSNLQIARGGCVDTASQPLMFTFMALGPEDVSRLRIGGCNVLSRCTRVPG
jgi:hypothetical protein